MNPNADYLGIVTLLRGLRERGACQRQRSKKRRASDGTAWRGHHYFSDFSLLGIAIPDASWYCVLLKKEVSAQ